MAADLELDMDDDICAVLGRAAARWGDGMPSIEAADVPCARARASNRLHARRLAARAQRPGESWSWLDHFALIPDELRRMGLDGAEGCGEPHCVICNTRPCPSCAGLGGSRATPA